MKIVKQTYKTQHKRPYQLQIEFEFGYTSEMNTLEQTLATFRVIPKTASTMPPAPPAFPHLAGATACRSNHPHLFAGRHSYRPQPLDWFGAG